MQIKKILIYFILVIIGIGLIFRFLLAIQKLQVTSWWRSPWHNLKVGGKINSLHQIGWGFDVIPPNANTKNKLEKIPFKKIIYEGDHYHVQII